MRFGILGRTRILIQSARLLSSQGHTLTFVATSSSPSYCGTGSDVFAEFAAKQCVPFVLAPTLYEAIDTIRETKTEIGVSINWPTILREPLLSLFPHGILNAHAGDLPRYRGNAVANWAILNSEPKIGLTVHRMIAELDAGPILRKDYLSLSNETYITDVIAWLEQTIPPSFAEIVHEITVGKGHSIEQSATGLTPLRAFPRKPEDSRIDWSKSNTEIHRLLRASSHPFAGAFTYTEQDKRVRIWRADINTPDFDFLAIPGQVCHAYGDDPVIACGVGMLCLTDCSLDDGSDARPLMLNSLRNRFV